MFAPHFPQIKAYFILEYRFKFLMSYFSLKSYIHLDCLGNITVITLNVVTSNNRVIILTWCYMHHHGPLGSSWFPFIDLGQENFHLCASTISEAGKNKHGKLSIAFYCFYTKGRHITSHMSLSNESHMSVINFKEVRAVHFSHLTERQTARKYL